jgi:hypothetical protein
MCAAAQLTTPLPRPCPQEEELAAAETGALRLLRSLDALRRELLSVGTLQRAYVVWLLGMLRRREKGTLPRPRARLPGPAARAAHAGALPGALAVPGGREGALPVVLPLARSGKGERFVVVACLSRGRRCPPPPPVPSALTPAVPGRLAG